MKGIFLILFLVSNAFSVPSLWSDMSLEQRALILDELEYIDDSELPFESNVLSLVENWKFDLNSIESKPLKTLAENVLATIESEISREAIEQSYYYSEGPIEITSFYVLLNSKGEALGGYVSVYQAGVDEDGNDSDISWSSSIRFNSTGGLFLNSNGDPVDDLYYEWSGH